MLENDLAKESLATSVLLKKSTKLIVENNQQARKIQELEQRIELLRRALEKVQNNLKAKEGDLKTIEQEVKKRNETETELASIIGELKETIEKSENQKVDVQKENLTLRELVAEAVNGVTELAGAKKLVEVSAAVALESEHYLASKTDFANDWKTYSSPEELFEDCPSFFVSLRDSKGNALVYSQQIASIATEVALQVMVNYSGYVNYKRFVNDHGALDVELDKPGGLANWCVAYVQMFAIELPVPDEGVAELRLSRLDLDDFSDLSLEIDKIIYSQKHSEEIPDLDNSSVVSDNATDEEKVEAQRQIDLVTVKKVEKILAADTKPVESIAIPMANSDIVRTLTKNSLKGELGYEDLAEFEKKSIFYGVRRQRGDILPCFFALSNATSPGDVDNSYSYYRSMLPKMFRIPNILSEKVVLFNLKPKIVDRDTLFNKPKFLYKEISDIEVEVTIPVLMQFDPIKYQPALAELLDQFFLKRSKTANIVYVRMNHLRNNSGDVYSYWKFMMSCFMLYSLQYMGQSTDPVGLRGIIMINCKPGEVEELSLQAIVNNDALVFTVD